MPKRVMALPRKRLPFQTDKPGGEILDHILIAAIELMEDQARGWQRSAQRAHDNDWGPRIREALAKSAEQPSAAAVVGYIEMCERCTNNLIDASTQLQDYMLN
jgi:hypothetical protein